MKPMYRVLVPKGQWGIGSLVDKWTAFYYDLEVELVKES